MVYGLKTLFIFLIYDTQLSYVFEKKKVNHTVTEMANAQQSPVDYLPIKNYVGSAGFWLGMICNFGGSNKSKLRGADRVQ